MILPSQYKKVLDLTENIDNTHELHTKIQQYSKVPDNDIESSIHRMIYSQIHIKIHKIESLLGLISFEIESL